MDESMKCYIKQFLKSNFKNFKPVSDKMPYIFRANWYCGKFEPTKAGRIHLHLLVRFLNFKLINDC